MQLSKKYLSHWALLGRIFCGYVSVPNGKKGTRLDGTKYDDSDFFYVSKKGMEDALNSLSKSQRKVLKLRFGLEGKFCTLEEVGNKVGVSRERVRQIEAKSLRILRRKQNIIYGINRKKDK